MFFTGRLNQGGFCAVNIRFTVTRTRTYAFGVLVSSEVSGRILNYPGPPNKEAHFDLHCEQVTIKNACMGDTEGRFVARSMDITDATVFSFVGSVREQLEQV